MDLDDDREAVLEALREGSAFIACPHRGDVQGARFWAEFDAEIVRMGREAGAGPGLLRAELPRAADVLLRSDGSVILARSDVTSVTHPIEAAGLQTRGASWRAPLASQQPDLPVGSGFRR